MKMAKEIAILLALAPLSGKALEVTVDPGAVRGVTIVSADIAHDLDSSEQMLVIRLRDRGNVPDEVGRNVALAVTVRDEMGGVRG